MSEDRKSREEKLLEATEQRNADPDALKHAHIDAQFVLEQTIQTFSDLSDKAFRLIRLNGLVLTILVAILSNVQNTPEYVNIPSVAAVLLFLSSTLFAIRGYMTQTFDSGVSTDVFETLRKFKLRETEYLNWILTRGYPQWIETGATKTDNKEGG